MGTFGFALLLTTIAGLSTGIGGLFVLLCKPTNKKLLSFAMGFSAGVMTFTSLANIYPLAISEIGNVHAFVVLFMGVSVAWLIDILVPHRTPNPHDFSDGCIDDDQIGNRKLWRLGLFSMITILIHNFPEGVATFFAASYDATLGISIMIAIALHNIPEGLTVAVPIYYATGSRKKAFWFSLLSGLSEPLGALVAGLIFFNIASAAVASYTLAFVAGFMIFIAFDELIPAAHQYNHHHTAVIGVISGMFIMGLSLFI